jgi:NAD(P)-dependent dehydrogenase (short-subunit alcohol dehydrogenase family)
VGEVEGQRVLVTAGAGGAGLVIASRFAAAGARVVVADADPNAVRSLRNPDLAAELCDAGEPAEVDRLFDAVQEHLGGLDVLVNNVGIAGPTAAAEDVSIGDWDRTLRVNTSGHFYCARRAIPLMKAAGGGCIVNISSASAKTGLPLRLPYVVSKVAVLGLTTNLARELGPCGIRVNAILPGAIEGGRLRRVIESKAEALGVPAAEYERDLLRFVSLRTTIPPDDIASMILFLASAAGRRITGQLIGVDGNVEYEL